MNRDCDTNECIGHAAFAPFLEIDGMVISWNSRSIRNHRRAVSLWAGTALTVLAAAAGAQDVDPVDLSADDIRRMADELRETREEVRTLRREVSDLRAMNGDEWLTEQRAAEIRSIVQDVLVDADTRQSLMQGLGTAGWDDGFFLASSDGRFLLELDALVQFRNIQNFQDVQSDEWRGGFEISRTELTMRGHIYNKDLTYLVRADVTRNEPGLVTGLWFLKDAWVRYHMNDDWSVRFGQFKLPFSREELVAPEYQLAVERSLINENTNLGRTQGVEITWATDHWRFSGAIGDGATDNFGGFNLVEPGGAPLNSAALVPDTEWAMTGRGEMKLAGTWEQFEDFTSRRGDPFGLLLGVGGHWQRGEHGIISPGVDAQETWWSVTADISAEFGGANLFAAGTYQYIEGGDLGNTNRPQSEIEMYALMIQGGWFMTDNVEIFARLEWAQVITNIRQISRQRRRRPPRFRNVAFDSLTTLTAGVNWYIHGHDSKLTVDFGYTFGEVGAPFDSDLAGWRTDPDGSTGQMVLRTQYQLRF